MSNLILLILGVNAIATLLVGATIYIIGKTKLQNSVWFVYNILFSIWNFCIYKAFVSTSEALVVYWFRAAFVALIFMAPVFLHFLSIYSDREVFKKQILRRIYVLFFLIFTAYFFMAGEVIKGITQGVYFKYLMVPGLPFHIFVFIFIGFILCGFYYLLRSEKKAYLTFKRNQRTWLFYGMFFGMLAPLNFLLATYGITFLPLGLLCVIPYLVIVYYAIVKYHVLEIDVIINKMVLLAYTTLFVILIHIVVVHILYRIGGVKYFESSIISGCIVLINLLFTVHYGRMLRLDKVADHVVYEKRLDYYKFLEKFNSMVDETKDLDTLLSYVVDSLVSIVGVDCVSLYLRDEEETSNFRPRAYWGIDKKKMQEIGDISAKNPLIDFLRGGNIFVVNENQDFSQDYDLAGIKEIFAKLNVKLTIPLYYSMPLYYGRDIVGFLNLGDKKSHADYNKEDIDILNAFGRQIGICLDNAKLFSKSIEDDLTKLYRHTYFYKRIEEELSRSRRYNREFSLLMIDIDDFKKINDIFGHQAGDEVLRKIAHVIKSTIRKADIAARYGGEEFGILMPETNRAKAIIAAERLRVNIEENFTNAENIKQIIKEKFPDRALFHVTVSIGVSAYRPDIEKYELVKEADQALYRAKREGKNRVCA